MMQDMYTAMGISPEVYEYGEQTLVSLKDRFDEIMETNDYMQGCKFDYLNGAALRRWEI